MIDVISYERKVEQATDKAIKKAVRMIGGSIAGHAAELCPVDTGLLRNSITFAIGGDSPNVAEYFDDSMVQRGQYDAQAPTDSDGQTTVYVGTNVQYAPYLELGTVRMDARPFIRPAFENNENEIEQILRKCFAEMK